MYVTVALLRNALEGEPPFVALFTLSVAGAVAYFAVIALISRRHLIDARNFARSLLGRNVQNTT
jgi:hypothetical protein